MKTYNSKSLVHLSGPQLSAANRFAVYALLTRLILIALFVAGLLATEAQLTNTSPRYNALYCFGFSWTDTQGLFMNGSPAVPNNNPRYWQNRASNGPMWPEILSPNLGLPYVVANNYARAAATTADTLAQANNLPALTNPERGLYVVWVAAGDFLSAADSRYGTVIDWTDDAAWNARIQSVLDTSSNIVERLYAKGARSIVIQNCLDLSLAPGVVADIGSPTNRLAKLKERVARFNSDLAAALQRLQKAKPDARLFVVDIFSRENGVYTSQASYGFSKVSVSALDDAALADKSFAGAGKDYMFWDRLHGTSKFHELVSAWTWEAQTNNIETLEANLSGAERRVAMSRLQIGRTYTLQESTDLQASADLTIWRNVTNFVATAGTNQWTSTPVNAPRAFYRLTGSHD